MGEVFQYLVESDSRLADRAEEHPGVHDQAAAANDSRRRRRECLGRHGAAVPGRGRSRTGSPATASRWTTSRRALGENNGNFGAGYIETRGERLTVRGLGRRRQRSGHRAAWSSRRARAARRFSCATSPTSSVGPMPREGAVSRDGRGEALSGKVIMLKGSNGREVVRQVEDAAERRARTLLPAGVTIRPFYSQGDVVDHTTQTVVRNLAEGGLLVVADPVPLPAQHPRVAHHRVGHSAVVALRVRRDEASSASRPT